MYDQFLAGLEPSSPELSRRAAERYALLAAVKERRSQERRAARSVGSRQPVPHLVALGDGCS